MTIYQAGFLIFWRKNSFVRCFGFAFWPLVTTLPVPPCLVNFRTLEGIGKNNMGSPGGRFG